MREIIVDSFAGGGGTSEGIRMALGRDPDIAINHDAIALAMHRINHPETHHLVENVWHVDPVNSCQGRPIGLFWMSPDCKHFSKAKGGKPRDSGVRGLAWVGLRWIEGLPKRQRPRVVILENVEEFQDWGPLLQDGRPCPVQRGATFRQFVATLEGFGYRVQWRELRACDYGAPTIRKRLFLIARRDRLPIVWPEPTHGDPKSEAVRSGQRLAWRTAAEIIDWSLPCPSIFETGETIKQRFGIRANRPLADATMARIAKGTMRYVVNAAKPYLVQFNHGDGPGGRSHAVDEPLPTITAARGEALVTPFVSYAQQGGASRSVIEPCHTITASRKDQDQIVTPFITKFNRGSTGHPVDEPLHTITSHASDVHGGGAAPLGIVAPILVGCGGRAAQSEPRSGDVPMGTQTAKPDLCLAAVYMSRQFGASIGSAADAPVGTITAGGAGKAAVVTAFLAQHNGDRAPKPGRPVDEPISTVTATGGQQNVVAAHMLNMRGSDRRDGPINAPAPTVSAGGSHAAAVCAFLAKYYGAGLPSQSAEEPLHTVTTKPRHGVVTVSIQGEPYVIVDIGMRMLTPRERFSAQGFRPDYIISHGTLEDGSLVALTLEQQGRMCGNSVSPHHARALVAANYAPLDADRPKPRPVLTPLTLPSEPSMALFAGAA